MASYYNENNPSAAQWLRELIKAKEIADGDVDERSIEDVLPSDVAGYQQCHFFAGIAGWSRALRCAGWPDDRPVWTGSCPCTPFSAAGKGLGFADERHLWPAWFHLISQCRPSEIFGEQVASKATGPWFDLVQADLEALGYAFGCVPFPAAGICAPHLRDRAYWVANSKGFGSGQGLSNNVGSNKGGVEKERSKRIVSGSIGGMADTEYPERRPEYSEYRDAYRGDGPGGSGNVGSMADANVRNSSTEGIQRGGKHGQQSQDGRTGGLADADGRRDISGIAQSNQRGLPESNGSDQGCPTAGPTNGHWGVADWLLCRDNKWRPVEPGTFPLVNGPSARVGRGGDSGTPVAQNNTAEARMMRLRGYGNAIVVPQATAFISSFMEISDS